MCWTHVHGPCGGGKTEGLVAVEQRAGSCSHAIDLGELSRAEMHEQVGHQDSGNPGALVAYLSKLGPVCQRFRTSEITCLFFKKRKRLCGLLFVKTMEAPEKKRAAESLGW